MSIQVRIPPALCAVHNFIRQYDPVEILEYENDDLDDLLHGERPSDECLASGPPTREARERASNLRDEIAGAMWADYVSLLAEREGME
jgi:hypothetical protein